MFYGIFMAKIVKINKKDPQRGSFPYCFVSRRLRGVADKTRTPKCANRFPKNIKPCELYSY